MAGIRILVVEDEALVAMMLEDVLSDLGYEVVGTAMNLEAGLALARNAAVDVAVLDINLGSVASFPIADVLAARGIPFVFATAYGQAVTEGRFSHAMVIEKPYHEWDLERALSELMRAAA